MKEEILNIATYKFVELNEDDLPELREHYREQTRAWGLKGTILLTPEGINCFIAGLPEDIEKLKNLLNEHEAFQGLNYKESYSTHQPFRRMLVKIKKEIIAFGLDDIKPEKQTVSYVSPKAFHKWYQEDKDMIVLDIRNDYEYKTGTFEKALDLGLKHFRNFPAAIKNLPDEMKKKPVVTFCTGGIRCEKAAEYMRQQGFEDVYQLEGGILNYFEKCGGDYYHGECFVFDKRVALTKENKESDTVQCFGCRNPLTSHEQTNWPDACPHCGTEGELRG